jgi:hypothetical protein
LAWRLLRGGGRRGWLASGLTVATVAVTTGLLLFALAGNLAFGQRADREAWRAPKAAAQDAVAVEAVAPQYATVGGATQRITDVRLAALKPGAPAPPGAPGFPRPGRTYVSPALADLLKRMPADQLADRFGTVAGTLGDAALTRPGELVAVTGAKPSELPVRGGGADLGDQDGAYEPTPIAGFAGRTSDQAVSYQLLTALATVLLVVPLLVFGGAAARLTVARRDQRLAALRLVGATPRQVVAMTTAEAVLTGVLGAVVGAAAYAASLPLISRISLGGGTWFVSDLWVGVLPLLGVLAGVPLLVGVSALAGLRRVVVSPLGVARRQTPKAMTVLRLAGFVAVLVGFAVAGRGGIAIALFFLGASFLALTLIGPWVVGVLGRITAATARSPQRLLAGRRLVDDPKSAWRTVSGVALTGFIAGFLAMVPSFATDSGPSEPGRLTIVTTADGLPHAESAARQRLAAAHVPARVTAGAHGKTRAMTVRVDGGAAEINRAKTALADIVPGHAPTSDADNRITDRVLMGDIGTGTRIVLIASFLVAIASAAITGVSSVLDRRQTYALLRLAGTPLRVLNRARRLETLIPLVVMGGGAILTGMFPSLLFGLAGMSMSGVVTLLICVACGFGGVIAASALSRPVLRAVTTEPVPRPD